jgi:hypothetical protein
MTKRVYRCLRVVEDKQIRNIPESAAKISSCSQPSNCVRTVRSSNVQFQNLKQKEILKDIFTVDDPASMNSSY